MTAPPTPPLVVHLIYRLDVGGLENGLVNLLNRMPHQLYRHAIVCLRGSSSSFRNRLHDDSIEVVNLEAAEGDRWWHARFWRLLQRLKPTVVHTRNLPTLEGQLAAAVARVPVRIHGEHGRDVYDLAGMVRRYRWLRRGIDPLVHHYVAVSTELRDWLVDGVGVTRSKVTYIPNGVDATRFKPGPRPRREWPDGFRHPSRIVIGTVGRMAAVKSQTTLVRAFLEVIRRNPALHQRLRLALIGDGPLRSDCAALLREARAEELVWMPGSRDDVPDLMREFDVFVLPSQAEGMSNTVLEAMASGLPVVATDVGANRELVQSAATGVLVPAGDPAAMADAIERYVGSAPDRARHGTNGRARVEELFGIDQMVARYQSLYGDVIARRRRAPATICAESQESSTHAPIV